MIDQDVLERVLASAVRTGARVRRGLRRGQADDVGGARRRANRAGHQRSRPWRRASASSRARPPASPTPPTCPSAACSLRPRRLRQQPARATAAPTSSPSPAQAEHRVSPWSGTPDEVPKAERSPCCAASTTPPARPARRSCRCRPATPTRASGSSWPTPTACWPADEQVRAMMRVSVVANGDAGMQTGFQSMGSTIGFEMFDRYRRRRPRPRRGPPGADQARRTAGAQRLAAGGDQARQRRRAVPRGVRPRSGGRPRRQGSQRVPRQAGRAGRLAAGHAGRRRHDAGRVGGDRHRRRGPRQPVQRADRGRRAHRLHVGLPAGAQGGPPSERQRPAAELHAPADGADDQHVRAQRQPRIPTTSFATPSTACTSPSSAAAASTRPRATSCSA